MPVLLHPTGFKWRFAEIARAQVGTREIGENGGAAVRRFQSATWLEPGPWPWCAAFVCWVYSETVRELCPALIPTRPRSPRAFDFESWGKTVGTVHTANPRIARQGDIVVFRFSHVGICVQAADALLGISCVEGNTDPAGSREGDGVFFRSRPVSSVRSIIRLYESTTPQSAT